MASFRENLIRLRKAKGWTQRELGERAGLSDAHVSHLEDIGPSRIERPHSSTVLALAEALGCSFLDLIDE